MKISGFSFLSEVRPRAVAHQQPWASERSSQWAVGELVQGRIAGMTPEGKVLLAIGDVTVEARSEVALKVGSEFWFEVRQGGSEPWLALAEKKGAVQALVQQLAAGGPALERLLPLLTSLAEQGEDLSPELRGQLDMLLRNLRSLAQDGSEAPEKLAQLVAGLHGRGGQQVLPGQAWLDQLAELLLRLRQTPVAAGKEATGTLERGQSMLAAMAHCNQQVPAQHQPLFWLFPCFFAQDAGAGSWLFQFEADREESGEPATRLAFFLEMSRLGEVQVQVAAQGNQLHGVLYLADEAAATHMREQVAGLRERLAALGYQPGLFPCRVARHSLLLALKNAVEEAARLQPTSLIDIKA